MFQYVLFGAAMLVMVLVVYETYTYGRISALSEMLGKPDGMRDNSRVIHISCCVMLAAMMFGLLMAMVEG